MLLLNYVLALISLLTLALAAPATNTTLTSLSCNKDGYGCADCTECCILKYTTASTGCAALGDQQSPLYGVAKPNGGCQNLLIGMKAARLGECTGWFDSCVLWSEKDCKGTQNQVQNVKGGCKALGGRVIKSVSCIGG